MSAVVDWSRYVGIPHADLGRTLDGCDCWGLVRLVYLDELDIALPGYEHVYTSTRERQALDAEIAARAVEPPWREVGDLQPCDVILRSAGRFATHVGLVVDRARVLHMHLKARSVICDRSTAFPRDTVVGVYRHEALS